LSFKALQEMESARCLEDSAHLPYISSLKEGLKLRRERTRRQDSQDTITPRARDATKLKDLFREALALSEPREYAL
jgi:hypothetical protein